MIDFSKVLYRKLTPIKVTDNESARYAPWLLVDGEQILHAFASGRDSLVFTNKRIIAVNVQGITGIKKDFTSLPYSRIQAYSVEEGGNMDADNELSIFMNEIGRIDFQFSKKVDIYALSRLLAIRIN